MKIEEKIHRWITFILIWFFVLTGIAVAAIILRTIEASLLYLIGKRRIARKTFADLRNDVKMMILWMQMKEE